MAKTAATPSSEFENPANPAAAHEDSIPAEGTDSTGGVTGVIEAVTGSERLAQADKAVRHNSYWAAGVGTIPVPIIDFIGVGAIQLRMVKQISELYGVTFCENAARNVIGALVGTIGTGLASRLVLASLIKTLPFAGAVVGGAIALPVIAGAATYALGRVFVRHYETGGDLINLSPEKVKGYFNEQYNAGKAVVANAVKRKSTKVEATEAPAAEVVAVEVKA